MRRKQKPSSEPPAAALVTTPPRDEGMAVFMIEGLPTIRAALRMLLESQPGMRVVGEADQADRALDDIRSIRATGRLLLLIGMDIKGAHDSFWLIRRVRESFPAAIVVACGVEADRDSVSKAFFVGVDGFVDMNAEPMEFVQALRDAARGQVVFVGPPTSWIGSITEDLSGPQVEEPKVLSDREVEVLTHAAEGLTARDIGERLGLTERTVSTHLHRIYTKLGVGNRMGAVQVATQRGLIRNSITG